MYSMYLALGNLVALYCAVGFRLYCIAGWCVLDVIYVVTAWEG